ncbi:MAG TPA: hypothetical protein VHN14_22920 [Kofleriaceae bacterium]|jgi:hypothetical protein|nr:hypothetical protein [Kofleriaceae bacterium]
MMVDERLVICAVASIAAHLVFAKGLDYLPRREDTPLPRIVQVRVVEPAIPEPPPEPKQPPEPPKPEPQKPQIHERPRPHDTPVTRHDTPPVATPPVDHPPVTTDTTTTPVFGVTMESTSQAGTGPAMPIGNTTHPAPAGTAGTPVKPLLVGTQEAAMSMQDMEGYDELMKKLLATLSPAQRLAGLDRDHQALALPLEVLRLLPEEYLRSLSPEVHAEIRRRLMQNGH